MIEVFCDQTGDRVEALTPEDAVVAARTLCRDAWDAHPVHGNKPTASFYVNNNPVRLRIPEADLWIAV